MDEETLKPRGRGRAPLDTAGLEAAALRHVERFQTTRARLVRLLQAKLRQRGWAEPEPPNLHGLVERLAARGYIDEVAFAAARARAGEQRGRGARAIAARLGADGVDERLRAGALAGHDGLAAAIRHARRRRLGPFGPPQDRAGRARQMASLVRAGHPPALARQIVDAESEAALTRMAADSNSPGDDAAGEWFEPDSPSG